jgi:hypothetical protein
MLEIFCSSKVMRCCPLIVERCQSLDRPKKFGMESVKLPQRFPYSNVISVRSQSYSWLNVQSTPGKLLRLKTKRRSDLCIISDQISSGESVTENGIHYGVIIFDKVFDNLSGEGMSLEEWLNDFNCRSGQFTLEELDSL